MDDKKFCPHCGKDLELSSKFCPHCGKKIENDSIKSELTKINDSINNSNVITTIRSEPKILMVIIIVATILLCLVIFNFADAREESQIVNISEAVLYNGQSFSFILEDSNSTSLVNQDVNVAILDANNNSITELTITTDGEGIGTFQLNELASGNYIVEITYNGDEQFKSSNLTIPIEIKDSVASEVSTSTSSSGIVRSEPGYVEYYPEYGPAVDGSGITREEAIAKNMHYIVMEVDGGTVGGYTAYDPNAGCYHT